MKETEIKPGDKVVVKMSDIAPFEAIVRSIYGTMVYLEGSSVPAWIGSVTKAH